MPTTTAHGFSKPASFLESADGVGAIGALADSIESVLGGAWVGTFVPVVTAGSGTFTSASATCRYKQIGSLVIAKFNVAITTNGSAAGSVRLTLPVPSIASDMGTGRANGLSGKQLQCITVGGTQIYIFNYDNTYPGATGESLFVSIAYEVA